MYKRDSKRERRVKKKEHSLGLMMPTLGVTIPDAVIARTETEWGKVAALGLIFIGLVAQVIYEQDISPPKAEKKEKGEE